MHFNSLLSSVKLPRCVNCENKGAGMYCIHQSQGGNLVDSCELWSNLSTSQKKSRGLLWTLAPHAHHLLDFGTLCQLMQHQQAPALSPPTAPAGEKGWALSWFIVGAILPPPPSSKSLLPQFTSWTRRFCFSSFFSLMCHSLQQICF